MEPIDPKDKKFLSPVFLVDPAFTKKMMDTEQVVFSGHDFGGYKEPKKDQQWPIIRPHVQ